MDALDVPPPSCLGEVCWSNDQVSPVCWGSLAQAAHQLIARVLAQSSHGEHLWMESRNNKKHQNTVYIYCIYTVLERFWLVDRGRASQP